MKNSKGVGDRLTNLAVGLIAPWMLPMIKNRSLSKTKQRGLLAIILPIFFMGPIVFLMFITLLYSSWTNIKTYKKYTEPQTVPLRTGMVQINSNYSKNVYQNIINNYSGGVEGSGIYDLAIALLNDGYVKDLMTICKNVEAGKYSDNTWHPKAHGLLAVLYAEQNVSSKLFPLPKGPFMDSSGNLRYNVSIARLPAEAMTWYMYNTKVDTALGGAVESSGSFKGMLQINGAGSENKANVNGYNTDNSREWDPYFLPDAYVWHENKVIRVIGGTKFLDELSADSTKERYLAGTCSLIHNRGSVTQQAMGLSYSPNGRAGHWDTGREEEVLQESLEVFKDFEVAFAKTGYKPDARISELSIARATSVILLISAGWSINDDTINYATDNGFKYYKTSWNTVYPNDQINSEEELKAKLEPHRANLATKLGISPSDCSKIYATDGSYTEIRNLGASYRMGTVFKVTDRVTGLYTNSPTAKQVHAYDFVTSGYTLIGYSSIDLWNNLIKYAMDQEGISENDPRLVNRTNTNDAFATPVESVDAVFRLLGINSNTIPKDSYDLITCAMKESGGDYSMEKRGTLNDTDGTKFHDCSSLVGHAIAGTEVTQKYSVNPFVTTSILTGTVDYLEDITQYNAEDTESWKNLVKTGDIFVTIGSGHTFIFLGINNTGASVTIPAMYTKRGKDVEVPVGYMAIIQASSGTTKNGIFGQASSLLLYNQKYKIKRLKTLV